MLFIYVGIVMNPIESWFALQEGQLGSNGEIYLHDDDLSNYCIIFRRRKEQSVRKRAASYQVDTMRQDKIRDKERHFNIT